MKKALCLLLVAFPLIAVAGESPSDVLRSVKTREAINLGDDKIAEYSLIHITRSTGTEFRTLFEDNAGRLLVIRENLVADSTHNVSKVATTVQLLSTMETFRVESDNGQVTAEIGGGSVSFKDADTFPRSAKRDAAEMLASASDEFQAALRELADVASNYAPRLGGIGFTLRELFFNDLTKADQELAVSQSFVKDFSPSIHEPDDFEKKFKTAYYE
ncbi:MAG: hypothetical protein GY716_22740 [bacterium]|nr:hypothetical protein [bacterium]